MHRLFSVSSYRPAPHHPILLHAPRYQLLFLALDEKQIRSYDKIRMKGGWIWMRARERMVWLGDGMILMVIIWSRDLRTENKYLHTRHPREERTAKCPRTYILHSQNKHFKRTMSFQMVTPTVSSIGGASRNAAAIFVVLNTESSTIPRKTRRAMILVKVRWHMMSQGYKYRKMMGIHAETSGS